MRNKKLKFFKYEKFNKNSNLWKIDDKFEIKYYDLYPVTYLKSKKVHRLRVVVNGIITNRLINIIDSRHTSYKDIILEAISDYKNDRIKDKTLTSKRLKLDFIKQIYNGKIVNNIQSHLLKVNKEENRDRLTQFQLI